MVSPEALSVKRQAYSLAVAKVSLVYGGGIQRTFQFLKCLDEQAGAKYSGDSRLGFSLQHLVSEMSGRLYYYWSC